MAVTWSRAVLPAHRSQSVLQTKRPRHLANRNDAGTCRYKIRSRRTQGVTPAISREEISISTLKLYRTSAPHVLLKRWLLLCFTHGGEAMTLDTASVGEPFAATSCSYRRNGLHRFWHITCQRLNTGVHPLCDRLAPTSRPARTVLVYGVKSHG